MPTNREQIDDVEKEPAPQSADYKFIFCSHTLPHARAIARKLEDCDVIAFELKRLGSVATNQKL